MAKYTITRSCGHNETIQIFGKVANRDGIARAESRKLCECCREAKRDADNAAAAKSNQSAGLPALAGSAKQVAWAETIRAKAAAQLGQVREQLAARLATGEDTADQRWAAQLGVEVIDATLARVSASAWIDSRFEAYDRNWLMGRVKAELEVRPAEKSAPAQKAIAEAAPRLQAVKVLTTAAPAQKTPKAVMTRAWAIAREGAAKWGGKSRDYIAAALKQAWAE